MRISSSSTSSCSSRGLTHCFRGAEGGCGEISGEELYMSPSWNADSEITCTFTCWVSGDTAISSVESSKSSSWSESSSQLKRGGEETEESDLLQVISSRGATYPSMLSNNRPSSIFVKSFIVPTSPTFPSANVRLFCV